MGISLDPLGRDPLDMLLGITPPSPVAEPAPQPFQASNFEQFVEALSPGIAQVQGQPHSLGAGLLLGLGQGLGGRGAKVAARRAQFEQQQREQATRRVAANSEATRDYRQQRLEGFRTLRSENKENAEYQRANPLVTEADVHANPALRRFLGKSVPQSWLKPETPKTTEKPNPHGAPGEENFDPMEVAIADAIQGGIQAPDIRGLYKHGAGVRALLGKRGYDLMKASQDWQAVQRTIVTLNGPQQTRLRQNVNTAAGAVDEIDRLSDKLRTLAPRFSVDEFNRAYLAGLKRLPGEAGRVARQLDAEIVDVTSELGSVYMGGNSPTDHALELAGKNLSGDWSWETLHDMTALARRNLAIRRNSIEQSMPMVPGAAMSRVPNDAATGDVDPSQFWNH